MKFRILNTNKIEYAQLLVLRLQLYCQTEYSNNHSELTR